MIDIAQGLAVVTCAETGLGQAMALELVRRGVRVAGFSKTGSLDDTARMAGSGFHACTVDVASGEDVCGVMDRLAREVGPVTMLINNAVAHPQRDFLDETPQTFMQTVAVNLGGLVNCCHAALQQMVQTGHGRILNVFASADLSPMPTHSAYVVSNGAARIFTGALREDIEDRFPDIVINDWISGPVAAETDQVDGVTTALQNAAIWGVELALWREASLRGTVWIGDRELLPPRSFKRRIKDTVLRRSTKARCLGVARPS